jgi:hydrogenase maturation factor
MMTYPLGKLPPAHLHQLLTRYAPADPRLVVGGAIGHDAAVIDMGNRYLVAKTDPITFATGQIGWYAVNINANDVACTGATPRWFLATLLLPENNTTPALVDEIFAQIDAACAALGVSLAGGHTEITHGLDRPLVIGHMLGEVSPHRLVTPAGTRPGDDIVLTKGIAIEATAIIAMEKREQLLAHYTADSLDAYAHFLHDPGISVVPEAAVAMEVGGVHAMHDPTEGGVATGLHELAQAGGVGLEIFEDRLPYLPETMLLCRHFRLDPLGVIASGALLLAVDPAQTDPILTAMAQAGLRAAVIGRATPAGDGCRLVGPTGQRPLPTFARDEITRLFE